MTCARRCSTATTAPSTGSATPTRPDPAPAGGRLGRAFAAHRGETGLIPYLTAGYPSPEATLDMMRRLDTPGVRALELGIPFSDPIADGPEIQRASEWAVRRGVGADQALELVAAFRRDHELPVVLMTYANPVLAPGLDGFAARAHAAGVDGVLISDLPPDESPATWEVLDRAGLDTVVLIAPTTDDERLPALIARARGYVYCLARTGVTGRGGGDAGDLPERVAAVRARTALPVAVGFGIATPDAAGRLRGVADAVVVGAAFMRAVTEDPARGASDRVASLAEGLLSALR